ncbi:c-type cytochrome [Novipirellula maiorica]|uniref:c-type cytochrome n=1 Tax=Novipirellula maiorica TaxID=1265734 RepID=UPI0036F43519
MNCTSCHLDAGTHHEAASFIGVAAAYPAWSPREGKVITLEQRICMRIIVLRAMPTTDRNIRVRGRSRTISRFSDEDSSNMGFGFQLFCQFV